MSGVTVRAIAPADVDDWRRLWGGYLEFYRTTLPDDMFRLTWQRLLDSAEPMWGALAVVDGASVGLVHYIEHRSCWTAGNYMYLQDLFVDGAVRSRGIGRTLI
jgi:GNAT superfamily N-acetyltransferase